MYEFVLHLRQSTLLNRIVRKERVLTGPEYVHSHTNTLIFSVIKSAYLRIYVLLTCVLISDLA